MGTLTELNKVRRSKLNLEIASCDAIISKGGSPMANMPMFAKAIDIAKERKQVLLRELMLEYNESMDLVTAL